MLAARTSVDVEPPPELLVLGPAKEGGVEVVAPFAPLVVPNKEFERDTAGDGEDEVVGVVRVLRKDGRECALGVGVVDEVPGVERDGVETVRRVGERRRTREVRVASGVVWEGPSRAVPAESSERWSLSTSSLSGRSSAVAVARVRLGAGMV